MTKILEVKNICHKYTQASSNNSKKIIVLENINFNIFKGEIVAVVGMSGTGKSTLVNLIAGYMKPVSGQILFNNAEVRRPSKERVVISQENDLFDWMTVEENMQIVSKEQNVVDKYLRLTHLDRFKESFPKELSGGMKKRLSLARAIVSNAPFVLMDEPLASLDYYIKERLHLELLSIFKKTNRTAFLVTHDIEEAMFLSDRVLMLSKSSATIKEDLSIPFKHPRKIDIKSSDTFNLLKKKIKNSYL